MNKSVLDASQGQVHVPLFAFWYYSLFFILLSFVIAGLFDWRLNIKRRRFLINAG